MTVKIIRIRSLSAEKPALKPAAEAIERGGVVAFPTETVYGLAASHDQAAGVEKIFKIKKRRPDKPLAIYLSDADQIRKYVARLTPLVEKTTNLFWPGPLTLLLATTSGDLQGFRLPDDEVARALIGMCSSTVVGTSANLSGAEEATKAEDISREIRDQVDVLIDGGKTRYGMASSVLDMSGGIPVLIREGVISSDELEERLGVSVKKAP